MAAPRGFHEQAHPLLGHGLVEETIDGTVGYLGRERALVVDAAGDDEHEIRKLGLETVCQLLDRAGHGGCIDDRYAGVFRNELRGQVGFGPDRENIVVVSQHLQCLDERAVVAEHDQALAGHWRGAWEGAHRDLSGGLQ